MAKIVVGVYGTLIEGQGNHRVMENAKGVKLGMTRTKPEHTLVSLGGFPGLIPFVGDTAVELEIYEVEEENMYILHRLEGHYRKGSSHNFYDVEEVDTENFGKVTVYTLGESYLSRPKIENGSWVRRNEQ